MALNYYIDKMKNKYKLYVKIDKIEAKETKVYLIKKDDNYSPTNIFKLFDDFKGSKLDDKKWDDSNVPFFADYSVSNKLNMWNDWGDYCDGSGYYYGIESVAKFTPPLKIVYHFDQENYAPDNSCEKTGATIALKDTAEFIPSTDTDDNEGINCRILNEKKAKKGDAFPNELCITEMYIESKNTRFLPSWDDAIVFDDEINVSDKPIVLSGDTDSDSVIDHIYKIFAFEYSTYLKTKVNFIDKNTYKLTLTNESNEKIENSIIELELENFIDSENLGLKIYNFDVKVLFAKTDDSVYYWDNEWKQLEHKRDELTQDDFDKYGMKTPLNIDKDTIQKLELNPYVLLNNPNSEIINGIVDGSPIKKLFILKNAINTSDWNKINSLKFITSGNGKIKFLISNSKDLDKWYYYNKDTNEWELKIDKKLSAYNIEDTNNVFNYGNNLNDSASINIESLITTYMGFAFVLEDDIELDAIKLNVDIKEQFANDTDNHIIKIGKTITITFNEDGYYKIVYFD